MKLVYTLILCSVTTHLVAADNCDSLGRLFYDELGCTPKYSNGQECPSEYDCTEYRLGEGYCLFGGHNYSAGQMIDSPIVDKSCNVACNCGKWGLEKSKINCAILDCPENMGRDLNENCHYSYDVEKCCAIGEVCPPFNTFCDVDGTRYKEGQKFYPRGTCMQCVCQKGFDGKFVEPYCTKRGCAFEIQFAGEISDGCAPVYFSKAWHDEALCCPSGFICPNGKDVIENHDNPKNQSDKPCTFGKAVIKSNEYFMRSIKHWGKVKNIKCTCDLPPYLTCAEVN